VIIVDTGVLYANASDIRRLFQPFEDANGRLVARELP